MKTRNSDGTELDVQFSDLPNFTQAYIQCALWSSTDEQGEPLDRRFGPEDLAPETAGRMIDDCASFQADNQDDLRSSGLSSERAGHDFWLNRNGHGSGFWDEGPGPVFRRLSDAAKVWGSFDLYVGDNGLIHGN